jgi:F-type H+-transporting ATPase subunit delta
MRISYIAKKYSRALLLATSESEHNSLMTTLDELNGLLKQSKELSLALNSPIITTANKTDVIDALLNGSTSKKDATFTHKLSRFIRLLMEQNRFNLFNEIVAAFELDILHNKGFKLLKVEVAGDLSEEETSFLNQILTDTFGDKLKINISINSSMVGGLRIWDGDILIDASLINQLNKFKERLLVQ